jgi:UDP-N-acetylglucosamine 2-epimerase
MASPHILTVFGTRPEAVKMAPVLQALADVDVVSTVCCTGQHDTLVQQAMHSFGITPDIDLQVMRAGQSLAQLTARLYQEFDTVLSDTRPDLVLVHGDTTSAMVAATCAFYHQIRIGHVEAGLRTGDLQQPFPEEMNRVVVGRVADLHFAPTEHAAENLRREGAEMETVHVTGNTVVDAVNWIGPHIESGASAEVRQLVHSLPLTSKLLLVTTHRRESFGEGIANTCRALRRIAEAYDDVHVVLVTHLNPRTRGPVRELLGGHPGITLIDPVDYFSLLFLMFHSHFILTDSGGIQEEAPAFGKPVLVLREVTERPEAVQAGCARIVGTDENVIVKEASRLIEDPVEYSSMVVDRNPFGDGHAGPRIAQIIQGHFAQTSTT